MRTSAPLAGRIRASRGGELGSAAARPGIYGSSIPPSSSPRSPRRLCAIRGTALDGVLGIESLRGVRMPWGDVLASTAALAAGLGITIEDDER